MGSNLFFYSGSSNQTIITNADGNIIIRTVYSTRYGYNHHMMWLAVGMVLAVILVALGIYLLTTKPASK